MIIAIDGPVASGKGTLARRLAAHLGYPHLDTGKLYRAVGLAVLRAGGDLADPAAALAAAKALDPTTLNEPELTSDTAGIAASKVAPLQPVRDVLLAFQRGFAAKPPGGATGAVLDGRDIGTVVCPDAAVKFFIVADVEVRAQRRFKELRDQGRKVIYARVLQDLQERDARDSERAVSPLRMASDAFQLDTSELDADRAFDAALEIVESRAIKG